jgi:signal transduction histidine kinase
MQDKNKVIFSSTPTDSLRFSTTILRLLGEELNPSPDLGILELIKNAYDADATSCIVELRGVHLKGGSIHVKDDGNGMGIDEIRNGWLIVGDSLKGRGTRSPSGRLVVGSKGLGRLGALRLGHSVSLITRPKNETGIQYRVNIDWDKFEKAKVVEDVEINIIKEVAAFGSSHGTEIYMTDLPMIWRKADIHRLARAVLLLRDPFSGDKSFKAILKANEFVEIERLAHSGYFSECDFHLIANIDSEGKANAVVKTASGKILFKATHNQISDDRDNPIYSTPITSFELWEFTLSGKSFATKQVTLSAVKAWLEEFGGVRLYHRGVRILPYGEPKNDWLDMNLRRSQSPELRPSTNNSLGCFRIDDPKGNLQQKTDRLGFVDSEAFDGLRRFAADVLDWMARERLRDREKRRKSQIENAQLAKKEVEIRINSILKELPNHEKKIVKEAFEQLQTLHQVEIELKDDTTQLYFTLGTVGTTAAAFAHQTKVPIKGIMTDAKILDHYLGNPEELALFREESSEAVKRIHTEAAAIYSFSNVTLKLLEHEKRRSATHSIHQLIDETVELLQPYVSARDAIIEREYDNSDPKIWCAKAAFEAILTNLLTNSLQAFEAASKTGRGIDKRIIQIGTQVSDTSVFVYVQDNGPGIEDLSIDEIWIAGKTTTEKGTGLGLAIVKDVIEDLRGSVDVEAHGKLGGAKFTFTLPLKT